jgi:autotransporter-associated beta strand protein
MLTASTVTYSSNNAVGTVFSNALAGIGRFSLQSTNITFNIQDSSATNTEVTMGWNLDSSTGSLLKTGDGAMLLSQSNGYGGGTTLNGGTLRLGNDGGLGTGVLILSNGTIASSSSAARTFANTLTNAGDVTFGDAVGTGSLTFSSTATNNMGGGTRTLTTAVDTTIASALGNGNITKAGSGTDDRRRPQAQAQQGQTDIGPGPQRGGRDIDFLAQQD